MQTSMQLNDAQLAGAVIPIPPIGNAPPAQATYSGAALDKIAAPWASAGIHVKQRSEERRVGTEWVP